jgi:hypothetical protein
MTLLQVHICAASQTTARVKVARFCLAQPPRSSWLCGQDGAPCPSGMQIASCTGRGVQHHASTSSYKEERQSRDLRLTAVGIPAHVQRDDRSAPITSVPAEFGRGDVEIVGHALRSDLQDNASADWVGSHDLGLGCWPANGDYLFGFGHVCMDT